jgi:hypothetical protein
MNAPYVRLGITLGLGAVAMFLVLAMTVGAPGGLRLALACLTLMMVAPLGVLMLLIMPHLYRSLRANLILYAGFTLIFLGAYAATHSRALADDQALLRARIAHPLARS